MDGQCFTRPGVFVCCQVTFPEQALAGRGLDLQTSYRYKTRRKNKNCWQKEINFGGYPPILSYKVTSCKIRYTLLPTSPGSLTLAGPASEAYDIFSFHQKDGKQFCKHNCKMQLSLIEFHAVSRTMTSLAEFTKLTN